MRPVGLAPEAPVCGFVRASRVPGHVAGGPFPGSGNCLPRGQHAGSPSLRRWREPHAHVAPVRSDLSWGPHL